MIKIEDMMRVMTETDNDGPGEWLAKRNVDEADVLFLAYMVMRAGHLVGGEMSGLMTMFQVGFECGKEYGNVRT